MQCQFVLAWLGLRVNSSTLITMAIGTGLVSKYYLQGCFWPTNYKSTLDFHFIFLCIYEQNNAFNISEGIW